MKRLLTSAALFAITVGSCLFVHCIDRGTFSEGICWFLLGIQVVVSINSQIDAWMKRKATLPREAER
jgi:hypothetical protein